MPEYPPEDQSQARADASRALTEALRAVADANERLQFAAAWVLDAFGDSADAETVRMLMPGRRSGRPPVPAPVATEWPTSVTGDESVLMQGGIWMPRHAADAIDPAGELRLDDDQ